MPPLQHRSPKGSFLTTGRSGGADGRKLPGHGPLLGRPPGVWRLPQPAAMLSSFRPLQQTRGARSDSAQVSHPRRPSSCGTHPTHAQSPPQTTTPIMPRAHPPLRAPPGSGAPGGRLRPQRGGRAGGFGESTAARNPMRASGARDGFGWRRRLRGRRARGGPASPAALPDRRERRHRERQGKRLGGLAGPAVSARPPAPGLWATRSGLRPEGRHAPLPAEVSSPGVGGAGAEGEGAAAGGLAWAGSQTLSRTRARGASPKPPHWPGPGAPRCMPPLPVRRGPPAQSSPAVAAILGQCLQKRGRSRSAQERPGACGG